MGDILDEVAAARNLHEFDEQAKRREKEEREARRLTRAYGEVGGFLLSRTQRVVGDDHKYCGRIITGLPETDEEILHLADSLALVAEVADERFMQTAKTNLDELADLSQQLAVAVDEIKVGDQQPPTLHLVHLPEVS